MATQGARTVYVGSYTPDSSGKGTGTGISRLSAEDDGLTPVGAATATPGPSFLARHPTGPFLYAVVERPEGAVAAFALDADGAPRALGSQPTGGADPCHLSVDPTGNWLVTANYTSGSVAVHPINSDGSLGERTALVQHSGAGPVTDRQEGPHAHQARFDPAGRHVLVNDLGTDTITAYALAGGKLRSVTVNRVPAGTGPRHLVFGAGDRAYLAGELDGSVSSFTYHQQTGTLTPVGHALASGRGVTPNYPSEIACSPDGEEVYVANRGANTVAVFDADLNLIDEVDTAGNWPRHLLLLGEHLYVANQLSDTIAILRAGRHPELLATYSMPSPACLLPARP